MKKQKIIYQNVKQIDLYQMVPCLRLYVLYSGRIQRKTSTIFIRTPDIRGGVTERRTDRRMDKPSHRDAMTHLTRPTPISRLRDKNN